ncbi:MAG: hypothetical protein ABEJ57_06150 [Halobacteriaceae archaeon]
MARPVPVLALIGLLTVATAVAGGATTGPSPAPDATTAEFVNRTNTSNVLRLPSTNRSGLVDPTTDLSTALSVQDRRTSWRLATYSLTEAFEAAGTDAQRLAVLQRGVDRAVRAATRLRTQQRHALIAYQNGSIDGETLLNRLAALQASAKALDQFVARIAALNQGEAIPTDDTVKTRVLRVRAELAMLNTPVRRLVMTAVRGQTDAPLLYLGVGDTGITLSTVREGVFVHDTVRLDNFADEPGTSNASAALDRWAALYPSVWDDGRVDFTGLSGAYRAALPFEGGDLVSYLDASTLAVYSETQSKTVTDLPLGPPVTSQRDELVVTVNRTYPGGPLRVAFHTATGDPLDGVVRVNGRRVGTTGADGVLWTVGPADQFAVTVSYGDRQIAVVVTPTGD